MVDKLAGEIVTPVIYREVLPPSDNIPELSELIYTSGDYNDNKCPFLRDDYKCNIYDRRPEICRKFGDGSHPLLTCQFIKKR